MQRLYQKKINRFRRMKPKRVQRKRIKGWKMPPNTIYVGRPSKFHNPFGGSKHFGPYTQVGLFKDYLAGNLVSYPDPPSIEEIRKELKGKNLACWCSLDKPCHADVLLWIANRRIAKRELGKL